MLDEADFFPTRYQDEANLGEVQTLRLGDYITQYDATISDHRPVLFRFIP